MSCTGRQSFINGIISLLTLLNKKPKNVIVRVRMDNGTACVKLKNSKDDNLEAVALLLLYEACITNFY